MGRDILTGNVAREIGDWTPVLTGSTSGTFDGIGKYYKDGSMTVLYVEFNSITTANKPIGEYTIDNLPFTVLAGIDASVICKTLRVTFNNRVVANTTADSKILTFIDPTSNGSNIVITDANFVNADNMFLSFTLTMFTSD